VGLCARCFLFFPTRFHTVFARGFTRFFVFPHEVSQGFRTRFHKVFCFWHGVSRSFGTEFHGVFCFSTRFRKVFCMNKSYQSILIDTYAIITPFSRIATMAFATSSGCRFTPREPRSRKVVLKPKESASMAVNFTQ
jgi:hypothetical protein